MGLQRSRPWNWRLVVLLFGAGLLPGACGDQERAASEVFGDPFAYCATAGTVDEPGPDNAGANALALVASALRAERGLSDDAPVEAGTRWRCMDGMVYACFTGANIPCGAKADISEYPSEAIERFCTDNPGAEAIPATVTGRTTIFAWRCEAGNPTRLEQAESVDEAGYISRYWTRLHAN